MTVIAEAKKSLQNFIFLPKRQSIYECPLFVFLIASTVIINPKLIYYNKDTVFGGKPVLVHILNSLIEQSIIKQKIRTVIIVTG